MFRKANARVFLAIAVSASQGLMAARAAEQEKPGAVSTTLTVGVQSSGSPVAKALLDASRQFEKTPYTIKWVDFSGADGAVEALSAGAIDLDVGLNFSTPVLQQANARQQWTRTARPYAIIGANYQIDRAGTAIVVHPASGIKSVKDLAGKSVSFAKGTANHYFLAIAAQQADLDLARVTPVLLPLTEARAAFIGRAVDGLVTAVTNARPIISSGDGVILKTSEGLYDNYSWLVARPEVLNDPVKAEAISDFLVRLQRANSWQEQNIEEATKVFIKAGHQNPKDAALNAVALISKYVPIDAKVIASNQDQADVFFKSGVVSKKVDASIAFDDRFNEIVAAYRAAGELNRAKTEGR